MFKFDYFSFVLWGSLGKQRVERFTVFLCLFCKSGSGGCAIAIVALVTINEDQKKKKKKVQELH
jgi:hypothetical protein